MPSYYFERALFIVGEQNSGKSAQLRSMFRDVRLGNEGKIPAAANLREMYRLSNERCLYIRLTSPHEMGEYIRRRSETPEEVENFLDKTQEKMAASTLGRRWNFACPLQPHAANHMPDVAETVRAFVSRFDPEEDPGPVSQSGPARRATAKTIFTLRRCATSDSICRNCLDRCSRANPEWSADP
jgi:hypothetical protein